MQDPNDPGTLDLVEACKRPLTGAERQKRRRDRLRALKDAEGLKAFHLNAADRAHLLAACDFWFAFRGRALDVDAAPKVAALYARLFGDLPDFSADAMGKSQAAKVLREQWQEELGRRLRDFRDSYSEAQHFRAQRDGHIAENEKLLDQLREQADRLERIEHERKLLEQERCTAMAAARVFEQRLRDAGLSTDYRG